MTPKKTWILRWTENNREFRQEFDRKYAAINVLKRELKRGASSVTISSRIQLSPHHSTFRP